MTELFLISDIELTWNKTELADELDPGVSGDILSVEFEETVLDSSSEVKLAMGIEEGKPKLVRSKDMPKGEDVDWVPFSDDKGLF